MGKGKHLAEFEIYVMSAVARLGDKAYGVTIRQEIESRCGRPVAIGAVYATLGRIQEKGYVTFHISEPRPVQGGRSRKYVRLTPEGHEALTESAEMLRRILPDPIPDSGSSA